MAATIWRRRAAAVSRTRRIHPDTVGLCLRWKRRSAPCPCNISAARRFVTDTLAAWDAAAFEWSAVTTASELTTDALLHAGTCFTLSLRLDEDLLRLAVTDQSVRLPHQSSYGAQATTGRGMNLVYVLSAAHGVESVAAGKTVWCEVRADAGSVAITTPA